MFEDTFDGSLENYLDCHVLERATFEEVYIMKQALLFLSVDTSKIPPPYAPVILYVFKKPLQKNYDDSGKLTVHRFVEIYYRFGLAEREEYEPPSARLDNMTGFIKFMMKLFHKQPLDKALLVKDILGDNELVFNKMLRF
eukprot:scaffold5715_cov166-Amphora_coffeaeformis.AAC.7